MLGTIVVAVLLHNLSIRVTRQIYGVPFIDEEMKITHEGKNK